MRSRVGLFVLGCLLLAGCGMHRTPDLSRRFITPGEPKVHIGEPLKAPKESLATYIRKVRHLAAHARPAPDAMTPAAIEAWDPELAASLRALALFPRAETHRRVADVYRRLGIPDAAYDHLTKALRLDPTDAAAFDGLARIWRDWGYPDLGLSDAYRAVYYAPTSPAARNTLGTLLQATGQRKEARRAYEEALTLDPHASYALNNLCYVLLLEGEGSGAAATCRNALQIEPDLAAARNNLGLAYATNGNLEAAREVFFSGGDAAAAQYNMGIVYLASRRFRKAAEAFEAASRARPALALARGRARQAHELYEKYGEPDDLERRRE